MQFKHSLATGVTVALFSAGSLMISATAMAAGNAMGQGQAASSQHSRPMSKEKSSAKSNAHTRQVQEALRRNGYHIKADGVMGPHTRHALEQYQRAHHLKMTGMADSKTLQKLNAKSSAGTMHSKSKTMQHGSSAHNSMSNSSKSESQ